MPVRHVRTTIEKSRGVGRLERLGVGKSIFVLPRRHLVVARFDFKTPSHEILHDQASNLLGRDRPVSGRNSRRDRA